ncbi:NACHT domain-containing protein [Paenarthrobacter ureafaciens]|uniref:NACHT domain-containing protein n=1 Tax=Paenarthrobacter ureafaciens TaxID=37931 RepID=UPI001119FD8E|nr:hypothetical protein [Paenarthrobacter ureafaciens]
MGNNATWFKAQIKAELDEWKDKTKGRRTKGKLPEYLLLSTNVFLSAVPKTGGVDTIKDYLSDELGPLGLKGWDFWDGDKICSLLDDHASIRSAYNAFITPGDVLGKMAERLGLTQDSGLESVYETYTIKSMKSEQWVRLGESGEDATTKLPLSRVAIDLPVLDPERRIDTESPAERQANGALRQIIRLGDNMLQPSEHKPALSNVVVMGGPGQGKSTLSQLLSQIYRLALIEDYPEHKLDPREQHIRRTLTHHLFEELGVPRPMNRRWPFTIKLNELGDAVSGGEDVSILRFMADKMDKHTSVPGDITPLKLRQWLGRWPWLLILDGLDEVPSQTVRDKVFETIEDFLTDARHIEADLFVVATTRPQGYAQEMSPEVYKHMQLAPLSRAEALNYVEQLSAVQYEDDDDELRSRVVEQAQEALSREATSRLMVTPLQVTIMTLLLARRISLPESKHELFHAYFSTIYEREMNKSHSHLSKLLREQRRHVEFVHQRIGLALQQKAEIVGHADALLTQAQFEDVIEQRLRGDEDYPTQEAAHIQKNLSEAALTRLVLLVPRHAGHVGFELRSIQEFLAATFFFSKGERHALEPFVATAHSTHWRHTWLLGAGRLFEEHETLRDSLIALIDDLGTQSQVARACHVGPLLALDVLDDDIAANAPKYRRRLARITLELLSAAPGSHTAQLNRALREIALADDESWQLVTEEIQLHLRTGGVGKVASLALLANWKLNKDKAGVFGRMHLDGALRDLDMETGGSLLYCTVGRPEQAQLEAWAKRSLTTGGKSDLATVVEPYLPTKSSVKAAVKKKLLTILKRIPVDQFNIGNAIIRVVNVDAGHHTLALVDHLMTADGAGSLIATALHELGPADAGVSDFLRTHLLRSVDRVRPDWPELWVDPLSEQ